jgi:hypothetical protein
MSDFTKRERQALRELAGEVYEAEAAVLLEDLAASFAKWRAGELLPSELLEAIHEFHQHQSRQLWSMYQGLRELDIVARGLAHGLLASSKVPSRLREKLEPFIGAFRT